MVARKPAYHWPLAEPTFGEEEARAAYDVVRSGNTTCWERVAEFERRFAARVGARHAVMCNSGSSADLLAALAEAQTQGVEGRTAVIPAVTWPTHVWSALMAGFRVALADVAPTILQATDLSFAAAAWPVAPGPVTLWPVHALGIRYELEHSAQIEDCCDAFGADLGPHPLFGMRTWSLFLSHHLSTGEGGVVTTDDAEIADELRVLRAHGWTRNLSDESAARMLGDYQGDRRYGFARWGLNVRPTEIAAAIGLVQLGRVDGFLAARRRQAEAMRTAVSGSEAVEVPVFTERDSLLGFPMLVRAGGPLSRDEFARRLEEAGVETRPILAGNVARQPAARRFIAEGRIVHGPLQGADAVHERGLYVGLLPLAEEKDFARVLDSLGRCCRGR